MRSRTMNTITADATLLSYLAALKEETFFRDPSGKVIGRFVPIGPTDEEVYARAAELFDLEEAKRRVVSERGRGVPLSEIKARLRARGIDVCDTP